MPFQNILLIDDDEDDREIFKIAIEAISPSLSFLALNSAAEALKRLESNMLRPDVIFLDLNMPKMNGRQFLLKVKAISNLKSIPVIIFSTSSEDSTIRDLMSIGAQDFITKPSDIEELIRILHLKLEA